MVYESDFYTTRRPYSRPTVTSYTVTRREVDWSKHPDVARPSQVPLPFLAFARRPQTVHTEARRREVHSAAPRSRLLFEVPRRPDFRYSY